MTTMKQNHNSPVARMLETLALMICCTTIHAQTIVQPANAPEDGAVHGMTLYFLDGSQKTFAKEDLQAVTYLPNIGMKVYQKGSDTSVDFLYSQMSKIDYAYTNANANWRTFSPSDYPYANRLEYPQLNSNVWPTKEGAEEKSQIVIKQTEDYGITFSLEWDNSKKANRWTCYTLHADNTLKVTDRNDDFKPDEDVAVSAQLADYSNNGKDFSRGHLCPSMDRQCSVEQNKQTFFLTNMQPQWQKHNGGLWSNLETLINNYATKADATTSTCDTLYVVKAATITDDVTINGTTTPGIYEEKCNGVLIVPKYFYMAVLHFNKATNTYKAVAFWTLHQDASDTNKNYGDFAISIDELEHRTGIDFFCNLPDEIEAAVETEVDYNFWKLTKSAQ
jgi:endonuclease G